MGDIRQRRKRQAGKTGNAWHYRMEWIPVHKVQGRGPAVRIPEDGPGGATRCRTLPVLLVLQKNRQGRSGQGPAGGHDAINKESGDRLTVGCGEP